MTCWRLPSSSLLVWNDWIQAHLTPELTVNTTDEGGSQVFKMLMWLHGDFSSPERDSSLRASVLVHLKGDEPLYPWSVADGARTAITSVTPDLLETSDPVRAQDSGSFTAIEVFMLSNTDKCGTCYLIWGVMSLTIRGKAVLGAADVIRNRRLASEWHWCDARGQIGLNLDASFLYFFIFTKCFRWFMVCFIVSEALERLQNLLQLCLPVCKLLSLLSCWERPDLEKLG